MGFLITKVHLFIQTNNKIVVFTSTILYIVGIDPRAA